MKITKDYIRQVIRESLGETHLEEAAPVIPDFREAKMLAVKLGKMLDVKESQLLKTLLSSGNPEYLRAFANALSVGMAGKK